ncbi:hypothetical protein C8R46DRAFT_1352909, partial [Mycena filopes]
MANVNVFLLDAFILVLISSTICNFPPDFSTALVTGVLRKTGGVAVSVSFIPFLLACFFRAGSSTAFSPSVSGSCAQSSTPAMMPFERREGEARDGPLVD